MMVPEILLSGNHPAIAEWRRRQSEQRSRNTIEQSPPATSADDTGD
jgi:tRNA G37 N-methylase TrmD